MLQIQCLSKVTHPTKHPGYTLNPWTPDMRTCQGNTFRYGFEFRLPRRAQDCIGSVLDEDPGGYRYFAPLSQMVGKQQ